MIAGDSAAPFSGFADSSSACTDISQSIVVYHDEFLLTQGEYLWADAARTAPAPMDWGLGAASWAYFLNVGRRFVFQFRPNTGSSGTIFDGVSVIEVYTNAVGCPTPTASPTSTASELKHYHRGKSCATGNWFEFDSPIDLGTTTDGAVKIKNNNTGGIICVYNIVYSANVDPSGGREWSLHDNSGSCTTYSAAVPCYCSCERNKWLYAILRL